MPKLYNFMRSEKYSYTPRNSSYLFHGLDESYYPNLKKFYDSHIRKAMPKVHETDIFELFQEYASTRSDTTIGPVRIKKKL